MKPLVLASTSPSRQALLSRLRVPFEVVAPDYREEERPGLSPRMLAEEHALGKARSVARVRPGWIVIGSDQVATAGGRVLGKPLSEERAVEQLRFMGGRDVHFYTGLALVRDGQQVSTVEEFSVRVRQLGAEEVRSYVQRERPLECAGSFRVEGLGIALMEELRGRDYTSLIGLPLIAVTELLARFGVSVLSTHGADGGSDWSPS